MQSFDSTPFLNTHSKKITRRYYSIAGIALIASLLGATQNTVQFLDGERNWQFFLNYLVGLLGVGLSVVSFWMIKRRRISQAGWLLIAFSIINGLLASVLFTGLGLSMQAVILFAGVIIAFEMLPAGQRSIAIAISFLAGLTAFLMDLMPPYWRMQAISQTYINVLVLVIFIFFGLYLVLNFKYFNLHTRFLFVVLGINVLSVLLIAITANYINIQITTRNYSSKAAAVSSSIASEIDRFIQNNLINVNIKANSPSLVDFMQTSAEIHGNPTNYSSVVDVLEGWEKTDSPFLSSYALINLDGKNILDTNQENINAYESDFSYFSFPIEVGLPYASSLLITGPDQSTINFSAPIRNWDDKVIGVLRIRYTLDAINSIVSTHNQLVGMASFGAVVDENGILLAHGEDPELITQPIFNLDEKAVQSLQQEKRLAPIFRGLDFQDIWGKVNLISAPVVFEGDLLTSGNRKGGFIAASPLKNQKWKVIYFVPRSIQNLPGKDDTNTLILVTEIITFVVSVLAILASRIFTSPIYNLVYVADQFTRGEFNSRSKVNNRDELGVLASTLNSMGEQLTNLIEGLEDQVQERTQGIETSAEIGRRLSTILNTGDLIQEVITQLQEAFHYYHVHIYLLDKEHDKLNLAGGTGEIGKRLMEKNHRIPVGVGLVGRAAKSRNVVLAEDTLIESEWLPNPLLPDTRSEISIPIILGDQVLGVLDVQEDEVGKLSNEDAALLQLIAGQVAIALRNAQYVEAAQDRAESQKRNRAALDAILRTVQFDQALQVATRELGRLVQSSQAIIRIKE